MALSRDDVQKVSLLARLALTPAELDKMTEQLAGIVGYVEQLSELNTDNVEPMAHALDVANVFADDCVQPSLERGARPGQRAAPRSRVLPRARGAGRVITSDRSRRTHDLIGGSHGDATAG